MTRTPEGNPGIGPDKGVRGRSDDDKKPERRGRDTTPPNDEWAGRTHTMDRLLRFAPPLPKGFGLSAEGAFFHQAGRPIRACESADRSLGYMTAIGRRRCRGVGASAREGRRLSSPLQTLRFAERKFKHRAGDFDRNVHAPGARSYQTRHEIGRRSKPLFGRKITLMLAWRGRCFQENRCVGPPRRQRAIGSPWGGGGDRRRPPPPRVSLP